MNVSVSYYTHIGRRKNNEDALSVRRNETGLLAVVADGLGGMGNGEYASRQAVKTLEETLEGAAFSQKALEAAVARANADIRVEQQAHPGAMTTVAVLWLQEGRTLAAHVGDSRIYQFRGDCILFQSRDHSMAQRAVEAGALKPEDIRTFKGRNRLYRALGAGRGVTAAAEELSVQPGDRFLLCSDGFWETLDEEEMISLALRTESAEAWLREMRAVVEPAARDNNTAVAIVTGA